MRDRQRDDRLAGGDRRGAGAGQLPAVAEVLDVEGDQFGLVVRGELRDELGGAEVGLVAQRREAREAQPLGRGEQPELQRQVAALGDQPDRARRQRAGHELQLLSGVQHAEAVGAEQHRARVAHAHRQLDVERGPGVGVGQLAAAADGDDRARSAGQRLLHGRGQGGERHRDHDELRRLGQLGERSVAPAAEHLTGAVVDQERRPAILAAQRTQGQPVAPLARIARGADERHRGGREQRPDGAGRRRGHYLKY